MRKPAKTGKKGASRWALGLACAAGLACLAGYALIERSYKPAFLSPGLYCPEGQEEFRCVCVGELSAAEMRMTFDEAVQLVPRGRVAHAESGTCADQRYLYMDYGETIGSQVLYFGSGATLTARARSSDYDEFCKELGGALFSYEGLLTSCEGASAATEVLVQGPGNGGLPPWPSRVGTYVKKR